MTGHDVFLSYSFNDQPIADGVCETLEANAIRCWLVSRDNIAGVPYGEGIIEALNQSRVMLLILTSHSNVSDQVHREVERAASKKIAIVAIRLEDIVLSKTMEYFLSNIHWLDALSGWPDEAVLPRLVKDLRRRLPPPRKQRGARRGEKKSRSPAPQQVAIAAEAGGRGGERGRGAAPLHGGLAPRPADAPRTATGFRNPYDFASVATGEMFKGRDDEVELLLDAIDGGTHTTVFGLQRMGKTSLVEEVIEDRLGQFPGLKESVLFAKVDFQRLGSEYPTYKDVFHAIVIAVSDVLAASGRGRRAEGLRGAIDAFFDSAGRYERGNKAQIFFEFAKVLGRIAEAAGRKIVLFLDEFSEVRKAIERNEILARRNPGRNEKIHPHEMLVDVSFMLCFSSLIKSKELKNKLVFIFAVRPFMAEYDERKSLQILKLTRPITLYSMEEASAKKLIQEPLSGKVDYGPDAVDYLYKLTDGHPYLIQFILKTIVDRIRREDRRTITVSDIKDVEHEMISEGPAYDAQFAVIDSDYSMDVVQEKEWAMVGKGTLALIAKLGNEQSEGWVPNKSICSELDKHEIGRETASSILAQLVRAKILQEKCLDGDLCFRMSIPLLRKRYIKQNLYLKYFHRS